MTDLHVGMFGKLTIDPAGRRLEQTLNLKAQELFAYLLIHRDRGHTREVLADLLWGDAESAQSRKNLRQALWKLRSALDTLPASSPGLALVVEDEWVQLSTLESLRLDVETFERAFSLAQGIAGACLSENIAAELEHAVGVYSGPFLENWYDDWCILERERLERMLLIMLSKLVSNAEVSQRFDVGLSYGWRILQHDRAHERTHQAMMRLYYSAGDRTMALRQFDICRDALLDELDVEPSQTTCELYQQIRTDRLISHQISNTMIYAQLTPEVLNETLSELRALEAVVTSSQTEIQRRVNAIKSALNRRVSSLGVGLNETA